MEVREASDGRTFRVVKVYYHPVLLARRLRQLGFEAETERIDFYFYLRGTRSIATGGG